jgi:hypothetical protein
MTCDHAATMRYKLIACLTLATLATAAAAGGSPPIAPKPRATLSCATTVVATSFPPRPSDHLRVLFETLAVPTGGVIQVSPNSKRTYWRFETKFAIWLRDGAATVRLSVPRPWRGRVALQWADSGNASSISFQSCPTGTGGMRGWTGGFNLSVPRACVPIDVRVGQRAARVTFAAGRRC